MSEKTEAYWDEYGKATSEESGGGGGIISLARIKTGYKVFASGVGQDESWFPASAVDKAARAVAKKAASKLADEHGCRFTWGIAICTPKEKSWVRGVPATWNVPEMIRFNPAYSDALNDIVIPSLKEYGLIADESEHWLRLGFQNDPWAVENDQKDDQGRFNQIAYVTQVFKTPRLAKKAIAEMPKGETDTPEGYSQTDWDSSLDDIKEALGSSTVKEVAADYDVEEHYIQTIADEIVPV